MSLKNRYITAVCIPGLGAVYF